MSRRRAVRLVATAIEVQCAHCGEALPDPDGGSLFWTPDQLRHAAETGARDCPACDEPILIAVSKTDV